MNGIRERKTTGSVVTEFFLNGSTILAQKTNGNTMWFFYDSNGTRVGFTYLGQTYYYAYNAQGDVVQILDSSNNVVVEYEYGPWGEARNITGSMANTIGEDNPFRYRGYYYDSESGLYYLNARYYDPMTHRFINPDTYLMNEETINLFVYCANNAINLIDPLGNGPIWDWICREWEEVKGFFNDHFVKPLQPVIDFGKKIVDSVGAVFTSLEVSGSAGFGVGVKGNIGALELGAAAVYNDIAARYSFDNGLTAGKEVKVGVNAGTTLIGTESAVGYYHPYSCPNGMYHSLANCPNSEMYNGIPELPTLSGSFAISIGAYVGVGGELSIGYNYGRLWNKWVEIWS